MRKILLTTMLCSAVFLTSTSYGCQNGQFGIEFINNTNDSKASDTPPHQISVQVQDSNGKDLTAVMSTDPTGSGSPTGVAELCFAQNSKQYKLWQYPGKGTNLPNTVYTLDNSTLVANGYYMTIYATDKHFQPAVANTSQKQSNATTKNKTSSATKSNASLTNTTSSASLKDKATKM